MNECCEFLRMSEMEQIAMIATGGFYKWSVTQLLDRPLSQHRSQGTFLSKGEEKRLKYGNRLTGLGEGHLRSN